MCDANRKDGKRCLNRWAFTVHARMREATSLVCAPHLPTTVRELHDFDDKRYKRVFPESGVRVFPRQERNVGTQ